MLLSARESRLPINQLLTVLLTYLLLLTFTHR